MPASGLELTQPVRTIYSCLVGAGNHLGVAAHVCGCVVCAEGWSVLCERDALSCEIGGESQVRVFERTGVYCVVMVSVRLCAPMSGRAPRVPSRCTPCGTGTRVQPPARHLRFDSRFSDM